MNDLRLLENDLVPVYVTSTGEKVVYGKDLYRKLEVRTDFSTWVKRRLDECDAEEKVDYDLLPKIEEQVSGVKHSIDYIIKLDIAKEMAMLERNIIGKQVRKYFIRVEKKYKSDENLNIIEQGIRIVKFIADDMRVNDAGRLLMYENYCKAVGIPTGFLPKYESNGSREMKASKHLLSENGCDLSVQRFNALLIEQGYLEERERPSGKGNGVKKFKALTKKGLQYGENAVSPYNQREVQPLYYSDTFMELYTKVSKGND